MENVTVVGIAGGTASGKTTLAHALVKRLGNSATLIAHDSYYRAHDDLTYDERATLNYDHPDAYETSLLVRHLQELKQGRSVEVPTYDFSQHNRVAATTTVQPTPVIIIEGILILADKRLRDLMDLRVFVDVDADIRILRRLARDVEERGRSIESVINQYFQTVKPMHDLFVEPAKNHAHFIVSGEGDSTVVLDTLSHAIMARR